METIEKVTQKYNQLFADLHNEFYETINIGTPQQERLLRSDKLVDDLNQRAYQLEQDMATELEAAGYLEPAPAPPLSTHWAVIDSMNLSNEKPVRVRRTWEGTEYAVNCYVTESIKDQYLAGDIAVGDYVMVEFLDDDPDRAVVFAKVFKTW